MTANLSQGNVRMYCVCFLKVARGCLRSANLLFCVSKTIWYHLKSVNHWPALFFWPQYVYFSLGVSCYCKWYELSTLLTAINSSQLTTHKLASSATRECTVGPLSPSLKKKRGVHMCHALTVVNCNTCLPRSESEKSGVGRRLSCQPRRLQSAVPWRVLHPYKALDALARSLQRDGVSL